MTSKLVSDIRDLTKPKLISESSGCRKGAEHFRRSFVRRQSCLGVHAQAEVDTPAVDYEVCDTLKVIALVQHFRSRGHLVAQLDPLQRVPYGTWPKDGEAQTNWWECL